MWVCVPGMNVRVERSAATGEGSELGRVSAGELTGALSARYVAALAVVLDHAALGDLLAGVKDPTAGSVVDGGRGRGSRTDEAAFDGDDRVGDAVRVLIEVHDRLREVERRARDDEAWLRAVEQEALWDPVTGAANRRAWDWVIAREEARAERRPVEVAIAVVDVDDLKAVNDRHGHLAGDLLLRQVAQRLRALSREADIVARIGGDEFGVLALDWDGGEADALGQRLQAGLDAAGLGASVGAAANISAESLAEVFAAADRAMYARKQRRKRDRLAGDSPGRAGLEN